MFRSFSFEVGYICFMNLPAIIPAFLSFQELAVILLIAVLVFGPKKIPEIARGLGEGIRAMKKASEDIKREIMTPVDELNPMKDVKDAIIDAQDEISDSLQDPKKEIEDTVDEIVGPIKRK